MHPVQLCVFCRQHEVEDQWRPFCSERCKMLDLARWADGTYRVPAHEDVEADEAVEGDEEDEED